MSLRLDQNNRFAQINAGETQGQNNVQQQNGEQGGQVNQANQQNQQVQGEGFKDAWISVTTAVTGLFTSDKQKAINTSERLDQAKNTVATEQGATVADLQGARDKRDEVQGQLDALKKTTGLLLEKLDNPKTTAKEKEVVMQRLLEKNEAIQFKEQELADVNGRVTKMEKDAVDMKRLLTVTDRKLNQTKTEVTDGIRMQERGDRLAKVNDAMTMSGDTSTKSLIEKMTHHGRTQTAVLSTKGGEDLEQAQLKADAAAADPAAAIAALRAKLQQ